MLRDIKASTYLNYTDSRFSIDVSTDASHRAAGKSFDPISSGDFAGAQESYDKILSAARTLSRDGAPYSISFYVHAFTTDLTHRPLYYGSIRYNPSNTGRELELKMDGDWVPKALDQAMSADGKAVERVLDLVYGGYLSCCHRFNNLDHSFTHEQQRLLDTYDSVTDLEEELPALLRGKILNPIRYTGQIRLPETDVETIRQLTARKWSDICQECHLDPSGDFPLQYHAAWDNGLDFVLTLQPTRPGESLAPVLSFYNGIGDLKAEIRIEDVRALVGTHSQSINNEIYEITIEQEPVQESEKCEILIGPLPGYTEEWREQIIANAAKAYVKYGATLSWTPSDAMTWALEETAGGPCDLPYDLYMDMLLAIDDRCNEAEKTLDFCLQQIQANLQTPSSDTHPAPPRSPNR